MEKKITNRFIIINLWEKERGGEREMEKKIQSVVPKKKGKKVRGRTGGGEEGGEFKKNSII